MTSFPEGIERLDRSLFFLINGMHADWLDRPMWLVSTRWIWIPLYVFLLYTLYRRYPGRPFAWVVLCIACCVWANDQLASSVFKEWMERPRPTHTPGVSEWVHTVRDWEGREYRGGRFGFYSSHAANLFGIALMYVRLMRPLHARWIALMYFWVTLVAWSRIYLGVHFPSDIAMGMIMGSLIGWIFSRVFAFLNRNTVLQK